MKSIIQTFNPDFRATIREKLDRQFFMKLIGFEITVIEEGLIEGELVLQEIHKQHKGFVHGGLTSTLADIVAGFAAVSLVPKGFHVVTAEIKVSFLNPGVGDKLLAKGWVLKQGKKMNFCEAEVYCQSTGNIPVLIAKASATMATISPDEIKRTNEESSGAFLT